MTRSVLPARWRRPFVQFWSRSALLVAGCSTLLCVLTPDGARGQRYYDRHAVPGNYTIGFYANLEGTSHELILTKGEDRFEAFIGITGDSTRVFSGLVFRVELPPGVRLDGPIVWRPLEGLRQFDPVDQNGTRVNFPDSCVQSKARMPVMVGRIAFRVDPDLKSFSIEPLAHRDFGLSVELCQPDRSYPKPYATGLAIRVKRAQSFWERITSWFG